MVHIPFFGIEFPEPRVLEIVPDVVVTFIKICSRLVDAITDTVYPLNPEERGNLASLQLQSIPREFDRVILRQIEGKIKNEEQLSSELEDASYDYYRRLIRTSVAGATEEGQDQFMYGQLFGEPLQPRMAVADDYAAQHPELFQDQDTTLQGMVMVGLEDAQPAAEGEEPPMVRHANALKQSLLQAQQQAVSQQHALRGQQTELQKLRANARTAMQQATRASVNAGMGIALGLLVFKGIGLGVSHLIKVIRKAKRKAASSARPTGPVARQPRTSASGTQQSTPAPTARPARGQTATSAAQASPTQSAPAGRGAQPAQASSVRASPSTPAASAAQQQQQQQQSTSTEASPTTRRARPSTRTR